MSARALALTAGAGSGALLIAALGFQAAGYAPCELCVLQRWPHLVALALAGVIWLRGASRLLVILGLIAALTATGLAFYHIGIEQGWWSGPAACSGGIGDLTRLSTAELMARLQAAPVVRCDEIAWQFLGISMAGWNAILSAALSGLWARAMVRGSARDI